MTREIQRVPDMLLELYLLEELSDEQMRDVEQRLAAEPGGMERLESLRQSNEAILTEYPVMEMTRKIEHAAQRARFAERRSPMIDVSKRWEVLLAAAAILLGCAAVAGFVFMGDPGEEVMGTPRGTEVGGGVNPSNGQPLIPGDRVDADDATDQTAGRNARARELKEKFERGRPMSEEDVDTTGLILAMERKANRALIRGNRSEAVETCESAREFDKNACPWLDEALAKFDAEGPSAVEEPENLSLDDFERADPEKGKQLFQEATKSMLKGNWNDAIDRCRLGLLHGENRCNRVLGISYKNIGRDKKACMHLKRIGLKGHDGLVCD